METTSELWNPALGPSFEITKLLTSDAFSSMGFVGSKYESKESRPSNVTAPIFKNIKNVLWALFDLWRQLNP